MGKGSKKVERADRGAGGVHEGSESLSWWNYRIGKQGNK